MSFTKTLWWNLIWLDRLCNWCLGGEIMHTISGRVGYNVQHHYNVFWHWCESSINWLAELFGDGPNHCRDATAWEYKHKWRARPVKSLLTQ